MRCIFIALLMFFIIPSSLAARAAEEEFEYGRRPPLAVFDPGGILPPERLKEISDPLTKIYQIEGIDVLVIVLTDIKGAPPEHVARSFAKAWCQAPLHCIVLHVPGQAESPWIFPAVKFVEAIRQEQMAQTLDEARRRAMRETTESDKVRAVATETTDVLRYWASNVMNRAEVIRTERIRIKTEQELQSRRFKLIMYSGLAAIVPLSALILLLIKRHQARRPCLFPYLVNAKRLGAPYAGGNHSVSNIGPLPPPP